jgi:hypothetical protein
MNSVSKSPTQFDFGENWDHFSRKALNREYLRQAKEDFQRLLDGIPLESRSFLDIGFGQGLSLLFAASGGARCLGIDINTRCLRVLSENGKTFFPDIPSEQIGRLQGSILDPALIRKLELDSRAKEGKFDIVHSWGVLHHTGSMFKAIRNSASLVSEQGYLVLAIYQTHWSSGPWKCIKFLYNKSPVIGRRLFIWLFYPLIYLAKWIVTRQNPKSKNRGMDFYHDVIDWVGGYPYEYANRTEITDYLKELGFDLVRFFSPTVPTGCMEFVFRKPASLKNL